MSSLKALYKEGKLVIYNFPQDNNRKIMKIKIFLNSKQDLEYFFDANLNIVFKSNDSMIVAQDLQKVISFIENVINIAIDFDDETKKSIDDSNSKLQNFNETINNLRKLKSSQIEKDVEFCKYKEFCDSTLTCNLRSYQYAASYYFTIGNGGFDFSVPGSGKTIISYAAYNYFKSKNLTNSVLIIGPISSYFAWYDEYYTCFGEKPDFISLANSSKHDAEIYLLSSSKFHKEITFINNDKAWRLKKELIEFMSNKNVLLIVDEAHKEKNPDAQITKAVMEISKYACQRIILTGTPMPNGYEDLYSLSKIYAPYNKVLPFSYSELKQMTKNGASETDENKLMLALKPIYSRVSKKYLLKTGELLPANFHIEECYLNNEQQRIYDFLSNVIIGFKNNLDSDLNMAFMKAVLIRKMQVSANPALLTKSITNTIDEYRNEYLQEYEDENSQNELLLKADMELKKIISESDIYKIVYGFDNGVYNTPKNERAVEMALNLVKQNKKVILWDVFVQNMETLYKMIKKRSNVKVEIINGTIIGDLRTESIDRFKNKDSMILIANPATLAESISLHKCCQNAIYVNRNFNAAQFIQSKDRIHRINMPKGTTANYVFLLNNDTIDYAVNDRLELKEQRMLHILDADDIEIGGTEYENNSFMTDEDVKQSFMS